MRLALMISALAAGLANGAIADEVLDTITVVAAGVSNMTAASAGDVSRERLMSEPLLRPAAILENVPGLIVTQHSGEGKANQYFMRAFNLDHGTDLALEVDDMPVNMRTHAHGQGYADLNFLIPELAADLHYKKGPYYADEGDFGTAGTVRVGLLNQVPTSVTMGYGEDGYRRALFMGTTRLASGNLLWAGEVYHNDGRFDVPDDYHRLNGTLRYSRGDERDYFTVTVMAYHGKWNSTDQVPERAVEDGMISRFGSLNPTDGGESSRDSLTLSRSQANRYRPITVVGLCVALQTRSPVDVHLFSARPNIWRSDAATRCTHRVRSQSVEDLVLDLVVNSRDECHRSAGTG